MTPEEPPEVPVPPPPAPARPRPDLGLERGWGTAIGRGGLAFLVMAVLGQVLSFAGVAVTDSGLSSIDTFKVGGLYFGLFHNVGVVFSAPNLSTGGLGGGLPSNFSVSYQVGTAMLLATGLAIVLLYRGGRAVADAAGGGPLARVLHGLKVAPPYAVLSLGLSLLVVFHFSIPANQFVSGDITIKPAMPAAFLWPLVVAAAAGLAGGVRSGRDAVVAVEPWGRRVFAALAGGWRMFVAGLVLAFVGLLVQAAVQPDATSAYFRGVFQEGADKGAIIIANHVLMLPNQSMFVLVPAMGGSDRVSVLGSSTDVLSLWKFPESFSAASTPNGSSPFPTPTPEVKGGLAPPGYFLYLLVPLLATLAGGRRAVRRGGPRERREAVWLGASAGVVFALLVGVASLVSAITFRISASAGLGLSASGSLGPALVTGVLLALVWGVAGGAVAGAIEGRSIPAPPSPPAAPVDSGFAPPPTP